jgi:predicted ArsR family transcriptional regulator
MSAPKTTIIFTPRMHRTLKFIHDFSAKNARGPSGYEIGLGIEMHDSAVGTHLRRLMNMGFLIRRAVTSEKQRPAFRYALSAEGKAWL